VHMIKSSNDNLIRTKDEDHRNFYINLHMKGGLAVNFDIIACHVKLMHKGALISMTLDPYCSLAAHTTRVIYVIN